MRRKICVVCTTPLIIHFFLKPHLSSLAQSCDVTLLTNFDADTHTPLLDLPVSIIQIPIERDIAPWSDLKTLLKILRLIRKDRYDLLWGIGPKGGLLGMLAAYIAGIRIRVFIFQGEVWASRKGFKRLLIKTMDKITARLSTVLLAVSPSERKFLIAQNVTAARKIDVLGAGSIGGVDVRVFHPDATQKALTRSKLGIPQNATLALFLGRLNRDKGIFDLLKAFVLARTDLPDLWLLVVGPDEAGVGPSMAALLGEQAEFCRVVGFTDAPRAYFATADFLCLPSYREGFPVSILEAAACAIPTIGSDIYGIADAIIDDTTGLLFPVGDVGELSARIAVLARDPLKRAKLGEAALARVEKDFRHDIVVKRYVDLFRHCLDAPDSTQRANRYE